MYGQVRVAFNYCNMYAIVMGISDRNGKNTSVCARVYLYGYKADKQYNFMYHY